MPGPMRIGVNALYLIPGGVGGTEIYLVNLLAALARVDSANEYYVFTNRECSVGLLPAAANFHSQPCGVRAANRPARILYEQLLLPSRARRLGLDVLFNPGFTAPHFARCPMVTVFHDLQHVRHPEHFRWFDLPFWKLLLASSARRSRLVVGVSEPTAIDIRAHYKLPAERVVAVPHGVDERFFEIGKRRIQLTPEPFLLCVSTLHPHKNLARLVRVFGRLRERHANYRLVVAGMKGFFAKALEKQIVESGLGDAVSLTGWISRKELYTLYEKAAGFVFPSTFEGFGMPVSEALAAGLPTACSSIPPLLEVAKDSAVFFPPEDDAAMLDALDAILFDAGTRQRLVEEGPRRAAMFTWRAAAENTLRVLRRAAS